MIASRGEGFVGIWIHTPLTVPSLRGNPVIIHLNWMVSIIERTALSMRVLPLARTPVNSEIPGRTNMKAPTKVLNLGLVAGVCLFFTDARADTLYVSNGGNGTIESFTLSGVGSVFATGLNDPQGLAFDSAGNLYVANENSANIVKFTSGGVASVFASVSPYSINPTGLAFDKGGNLFAATSVNNSGTIVKFTSDGSGSFFANTSFATGGAITEPQGLAFDGEGNLLAGDIYGRIDKFTPDGVGSVFATTGSPYGLAFDSAGDLFVSTFSLHTILKFAPDGSGSVFANTGSNFPLGLTFDSMGNLYVAYTFSSKIEKFSSTGSDLGVFASTGVNQPTFITMQIPEPNTLILLLLGTTLLLGTRRLRCSS